MKHSRSPAELPDCAYALRKEHVGILGHAKVDTTSNVYTQVLDESVRAAAETVGRELFSIVQSPAEASGLTH